VSDEDDRPESHSDSALETGSLAHSDCDQSPIPDSEPPFDLANVAAFKKAVSQGYRRPDGGYRLSLISAA